MATDNELKTFREEVTSFMQGGGVISGGGASFVLKPATESVLGGVKIGTGLEMDSDNKLNVMLAAGTDYTLPTASTKTKGGVKVGTGLEMDGETLNCTISSGTLSEATTSAKGLMTAADKTKLDGIDANANNYSLPAATTSALGGVKIGTGLAVNKGTVSLAAAKADVLGGVKVGNGLAIDSGGVLYISNSVILSTAESDIDGAMWYEE